VELGGLNVSAETWSQERESLRKIAAWAPSDKFSPRFHRAELTLQSGSKLHRRLSSASGHWISRPDSLQGDCLSRLWGPKIGPRHAMARATVPVTRPSKVDPKLQHKECLCSCTAELRASGEQAEEKRCLSLCLTHTVLAKSPRKSEKKRTGTLIDKVSMSIDLWRSWRRVGPAPRAWRPPWCRSLGAAIRSRRMEMGA